MTPDKLLACHVAVAASMALAFSLLSSSSALAGMTDLETGDKCVGTECFGTEPGEIGTDRAPPADNSLSEVTTEDCSSADAQRIGFAVKWLQDNLPLIDAKMAESVILQSWPGNSRENFADKLDKRLKFVCISQKNKCSGLFGITYPVFAQKRVNLCTSTINDAADHDPYTMDALYIHTVSHEIGHLIRLNAHGNDCVKRFTEPTFSDALGFAAEYAFRGIPYDPAVYTKGCPGQSAPERFDLSDKLNNMEQPIQSEK